MPNRVARLSLDMAMKPILIVSCNYDASQKRFSLSRDQFGHPISGKENPVFQSRWIQLNAEKDHHFRSFAIPTPSKYSWMAKLSR